MYRKYESVLTKGTAAETFGSKPQRILGNRFLKRGDIPESVRASMGEIKEPAYPVARGIAQLTHDVETAKLFREVADNPEWASDTVKEGFVQLSGQAKKLGKLANKYVHPEIARDINEMVRVPETVERVYKDLLGKWKFGKVVLNPATHVRNLIGNSIMLDQSGVDLAQQPKLIARSLQEMKGSGKFFTEAKDGGLFGNEFVGSEIVKLLDNFNQPAETVFGKMMNIARASGNKAAEVYQGSEKLFKLAKFISEREKGATAKEAIEEAEKWLFNYNKIAPATKFLKNSPVGSPFITYTAKAMPRLAETAMTNPMRLYKYKILFDSIENIAREKLNISDADMKTLKRNARGQVVVLPFKDDAGNYQTLDLSYILPWGDIGETGGLFGLPSRLSPSGPLKAVAEVGFNKSTFLDKPIYLKTDPAGEKVRKSVDFLYKAFLPSFSPPVPGVTKGGYSFSKLQSALEGVPDYQGRVRSVSKVMADTMLGLKVSPADPKTDLFFEKLGLRADFDEIKKEYKGIMRNQSKTQEEKERAREMLQRKIQRLLLEKSKLPK
jgi:hypothetical protein